MCNCGKKRTAYSQQTHADVNTQTRNTAQTSPAYASFEYTGRTALTLVGNVTGTRYRFNYPGTRQNIDHRDVPGITAVPVLRKVS